MTLPPISVTIVWLARRDLNTRAGAVDSAPESAHKCGIATLAEEHQQESSAKSWSAIPVNVFPVSFVVIIRQRLTKRWDAIVQQALAGLRSPHPPAQSLE
jgi:hypothetical protein